EEPTKRTAQSSAPTLSWAEVIEAEVDPAVVTDPALRDAIKATGLPWRVRDKGTNIEMLLIPPGEFVMGKSIGDDKAREGELPAHEVKLTKAFYLGRYEVTQEQFEGQMRVNRSRFAKFVAPTVEALMKDGSTKSEAQEKVKSWVAPQPASDAKGKEWPVESVSWDDCAAFCKKAGFRLPTEAEWEYACRAGTRTPRYGELGEIAWYNKNSNDETKAVGTKQANALGLHDMLGNVWEWVNDWYGDYSADAQTNPQGPASGSFRVLRGGGWSSSSHDCRASGHYYDNPDFSISFIGFRVARFPADAAAEQREEPTKRTAQSSAPTLSWAEVIEAEVDPAVVTDPAL
ncbi:MAG: formylglycine-generating enzyme family protein, partial [Nitrospira sp.]|nr:formylglycine-generating enzyme family protein [Nitrospira sp.]